VHHLYLGAEYAISRYLHHIDVVICLIPTGDYKREYPDAKLIAPKEAIERHGDESLEFDGGNYLYLICIFF
jgi:hypothetical protein